MSQKFHVGQKVRRTCQPGAGIKVGGVYTVLADIGNGQISLEEFQSASGNAWAKSFFEIVPGFVSQAPEAPPMILSEDAKERKSTPITTGVLDYFPRALAAVAQCSKAGNDQHNPGQPLHWDKSKSTDHADCIARHLIDRDSIDTDGIAHAAKLAWRALALLEIKLLEEQHGKQ